MDQSAFRNDIIDLFSRKRGGHVERWLYAGIAPDGMRGSDLWATFLRASRNYYVLSDEITLIADVADALKPSLKTADTVVDFGPGSAVERKSLPLARACENATTYVAVDLSAQFLRDACALMAARTGLATVPIEQDFYRDDFALPGRNRLGMFFGLTISNADLREGEPLPRADIKDKLEHMGILLCGEGENELLVSFDANEDRASIERGYDDPNWKRFVANLAYAIAGIVDPGGNFIPSAWRYEAVWGAEAHVLHACIAATADQEFAVDGHAFSISKGERFVAINLCKFPVEWFQEVSCDAGFSLGKPFFGRERRIVIQPLFV